MRKAFTLVELLVIIGIMAAMVTMSVISVRSGQDAYRLKGTTRDILAKVRYARSLALVSRNSVKVVYSNTTIDDSPVVNITITPLKDGMISAFTPSDYQPLSWKSENRVTVTSTQDNVSELKDGEGETIDELLRPELNLKVAQGVKILVVGHEAKFLSTRTDAQKRSRMSISGTNFKYQELTDSDKVEARSTSETKTELVAGELNEVVWDSLGVTEEHTIYIYNEGTDFTDGYKIHVDSMGGVKVLGPNEEIED